MANNYKKFGRISPEMLKKLMSLPKEEGIKLMERVNYKFYLEKENILKQAFDENLLTQEEYEEKYKDRFYDDYGSDSFIQYINAVMNAKVDCFMTENERMLARKEEFKTKFGLRIAGPDEILEEDGKNR